MTYITYNAKAHKAHAHRRMRQQIAALHPAKPSLLRDIATGIGFGVLMLGAFGAASVLAYGAAYLSALVGGL